MSNDFLVKSLIESGYLKTPRIIDAFKRIDRVDFVPENLKDEAYVDAPLPIGQGQTISQPATVAFMLELLQPEPGNVVLDVGFGSGWTAALLAEIVSATPVIARSEINSSFRSEQAPQSRRVTAGSPRPASGTRDNGRSGKVYAIERIQELCEYGRENITKYNYIEKRIAECLCADGTKGYAEGAPFDRILASASGKELPESWKEQLKINGRIVVPLEWSVWLFIKKGEKEFEEKEFPGFAFVPLISD